MSMKLISTITAPVGGLSSMSFTNIPQTGTDLIILYSARTDIAASNPVMVVNSDTTNTVYSSAVTASNATLNVSTQTPGTNIQLRYGIASSVTTASNFSNMEIRIHDYTSSTTKSVSATSVVENYAAGSNGLSFGDAVTNSALPVTSILIYGYTMVEGSTASLYMVTAGNGGATVTTA